jgi:hypothetical protein
MDIDQFRKRFSNETVCRAFLESILWRHGRFCPHCCCSKSYALSGQSVRTGLYECASWLQKTVYRYTENTGAQHQTFSLEMAIAMYYITNSSKGVSSVFLAKWVGISQKSA